MKKHHKILHDLHSYVLIIIGALLASFSVACILLPNDAIDYGTAGIAIIISKMTGLGLSLCVLCVVLPFLICGIIYLGKVFCLKAVIGSVVYMVGLDYFERMPFSLNTEHFLAVAFGGALLGAGLSLILKFGGCIDGSEILANVIVKKLSDKTGRNYSMNVILIIFNALVYTAAFILIDKSAALLSLLVYIVATAIIDHFTDHFEAIKQVRIITKNPEEMIRGIRDDLGKTCTIVDSYGAIAGENKTLICYVNYFELQKLRDLINRFEEPSFTTISTIDEIIR
ncbi:MAG: YitT family protein [Lachnospiraceae bacterium]|nr:YitT family protein [Lachnospiraceae bacterium]